MVITQEVKMQECSHCMHDACSILSCRNHVFSTALRFEQPSRDVTADVWHAMQFKVDVIHVCS